MAQQSTINNMFDALDINDHLIEIVFEEIIDLLENLKYLQLIVVKSMLQSLVFKCLRIL